MEEKELEEILKNHQHFLKRDIDGWENMRASLQFADLKGANLEYADLKGAILRFADLRNANLNHADLSGADLRFADLKGANLLYINLHNVNLEDANLEGANLWSACLNGTNLFKANLSCADLRFADLKWAYLQSANLTNANLKDAKLDFANLSDAILSKRDEKRKGEILTTPITGWKKCEGDVIVELEIPKGATVFCINGKKCRTNKCKVISISKGNEGISMYNIKFIYKVGKEIEIKNFNQSYNVECGSGIHFFKNRNDAEKYSY